MYSYIYLWACDFQLVLLVFFHPNYSLDYNCSYIAFLEQNWIDFQLPETNFAGSALIDPILIYVIDNMIINRLSDVRQIPGNGSYQVFVPRASITK